MNDAETEKVLAARAAVALVEAGMRVGLGTGSTAAYVVEELGARVRDGLVVRAVATSRRTERLAREAGIRVEPLDDLERLDLTLDGADEIDPALRLLKGRGGALLREKIVASASARLVIVADRSKLVARLGHAPLPIEVVPFGWRHAARAVEALGATVELRRAPYRAPFVTDEGHLILDARFGVLDGPEALAASLDGIVGVVEHGLFLGMTTQVVVGDGPSARWLSPRHSVQGHGTHPPHGGHSRGGRLLRSPGS